MDSDYLQNVVVDGKKVGEMWAALLLKLPLDPTVPVSFTRPVFSCPAHAKYKGTGDPCKAENFEVVASPSR